MMKKSIMAGIFLVSTILHADMDKLEEVTRGSYSLTIWCVNGYQYLESSSRHGISIVQMFEKGSKIPMPIQCKKPKNKPHVNMFDSGEQ